MEWLGYPAVDEYKGLALADLPLNRAWVVANTSVEDISIFSVKDGCFNCPYKLEKHLRANRFESWQVDTSRQLSWRVVQTSQLNNLRSPKDRRHVNLAMGLPKGKPYRGWICQMRPTFHEYGVYRLDVGRCEVRPEVQAVHTYFPLILFSLILLGVCTIYTSANYFWKRRRQHKEAEITGEKDKQIEEEIIEERFESLYLYRGVLLSLIIFFSTGGGGYPLFNNTYGGLNLTECLFFAYIWSIGFRIPTVLNKASKLQTKCANMRNIFVRSFALILLGTAIDFSVERRGAGGAAPARAQLWGPVQRVGLGYLVVATAYLLTVQKFDMKAKRLICKAMSNLVTLLWCWIISGFLLAIIVILISTFISFNCLAQLTIQDQVAEKIDLSDEASQNCNNQVTEYANIIFVGESKKMVNGKGYIGFSAGVMGVMSSIMVMMIGLKSGVVYLHYQSHSDRFRLWTLWATLFGVGSVVFAALSYPLDFNLWPISFILIMSAVAAYLFSCFYFVADVWNLRSKIMTSVGVTSLVVLCGHVLFSYSLPFSWQIHFNNHLLYLLQNLWITFLWILFGIILNKKDVRFDM